MTTETVTKNYNSSKDGSDIARNKKNCLLDRANIQRAKRQSYPKPLRKGSLYPLEDHR